MKSRLFLLTTLLVLLAGLSVPDVPLPRFLSDYAVMMQSDVSARAETYMHHLRSIHSFFQRIGTP